jgi:hypothetical protein
LAGSIISVAVAEAAREFDLRMQNAVEVPGVNNLISLQRFRRARVLFAIPVFGSSINIESFFTGILHVLRISIKIYAYMVCMRLAYFSHN